jgi:hypothetical protein
VDFVEAVEILTVLRATGKALEADDAAQAGNGEFEPVVIGAHRFGGHSLEVERRQAPSHYVDDPGAGYREEMGLAEQMLVAQRLLVALTNGVQLPQGSENAAVVIGIVRNEEFDVLGGADEAVGHPGEAPDDHEAGGAPTIAPAATSSLGSSGEAIAPINRAQKTGGLRRKMLATAQKLADRRIRRGR